MKEVDEVFRVKEYVIVHFDDVLGVGAKVGRPLEGDDRLDGEIAVRVMVIPVKDILKGKREKERNKGKRDRDCRTYVSFKSY